MKKPFDIDHHAQPHVLDLHAYVPGEQPKGDGWVKLNTNESPYSPSPAVNTAITDELNALRLYPEPTSHALRAAIGSRFGLAGSNVILGNGSDNLLDLLVRCLPRTRERGIPCQVIRCIRLSLVCLEKGSFLSSLIVR